MTCPYCACRSLIKIGDYISATCTNSYCQQAAYQAVMAKLKRKRR